MAPPLTDKPTTSDVCRSRASEARRFAMDAATSTDRAAWLDAARLWSALAGHAGFDAPLRLRAARLSAQAFARLG